MYNNLSHGTLQVSPLAEKNTFDLISCYNMRLAYTSSTVARLCCSWLNWCICRDEVTAQPGACGPDSLARISIVCAALSLPLCADTTGELSAGASS